MSVSAFTAKALANGEMARVHRTESTDSRPTKRNSGGASYIVEVVMLSGLHTTETAELSREGTQ